MAQRIIRAKAKSVDAGIPYRVPSSAGITGPPPFRARRLYLVFNEGYAATSGDRLAREDLTAEAIRLGRAAGRLMPDEPEVLGLLALMLLIEAAGRRAPAQTAPWCPCPNRIARCGTTASSTRANRIVRRCLRRNVPGPYQIQAAINAVHTDAPSADATDWRQILALYDQLVVFDRSPVVVLNRAVAWPRSKGSKGPSPRSTDCRSIPITCCMPSEPISCDERVAPSRPRPSTTPRSGSPTTKPNGPFSAGPVLRLACR